jgi:hypothetical protein
VLTRSGRYDAAALDGEAEPPPDVAGAGFEAPAFSLFLAPSPDEPEPESDPEPESEPDPEVALEPESPPEPLRLAVVALRLSVL